MQENIVGEASNCLKFLNLVSSLFKWEWQCQPLRVLGGVTWNVLGWTMLNCHYLTIVSLWKWQSYIIYYIQIYVYYTYLYINIYKKHNAWHTADLQFVLLLHSLSVCLGVRYQLLCILLLNNGLLKYFDPG